MKKNNNKLTKEDLEELYSYDGLSMREIAGETGKTRGQIEHLMEKYDIPRRTASQAQRIRAQRVKRDKIEEAKVILEDTMRQLHTKKRTIKPVHRSNILVPLSKSKNNDCALTLVLSDLHIGDANHLPDTYWSTIKNVLEIIKSIKKNYKVRSINLVLNGDMVSGREVYKLQELRNILQRGHWQVFMCEYVIKKTMSSLENILNRKINRVYLVRGTHECYDDQTEILTKDGFKKYNELIKGEQVLTYNKDIHSYEWNSLTNIFNDQYNGDLLKIDFGFGEQLVTPNHRCIFKDRTASKFRNKCIIKELLAKDITKTKWRKSGQIKNLGKWGLLNDVDWHGVESGYSINELKLIAWLLSEGSREKKPYGWRYCIKQKNPKYVLELIELFKNLHLDPHHRLDEKDCHIWRFRKEDNLRIMEVLKGCWKLISREILDSTKEELSLFYSELAKGDGTLKRKGDKWIYYTNNVELRDQIQELLLKLGRHTGYYKRTDNTFGKYICDDDYIVYNRKKSGSIKSIENIRYEGIVWCPTVKNGYVVMRRGKVPFISGNSLASNFILYLKRMLGNKAYYLSHGGVVNIADPIGEYNVFFTHGRSYSEYCPVPPRLIRDCLELVNTYKSNNINIERVCSAHTHWLCSSIIYGDIYWDVTGGFQKWEYTVSQRPCGAILYFFANNELSVIPVRPDSKIEKEERSEVGLEYKNLTYYGEYLLKHLKEIERV